MCYDKVMKLYIGILSCLFAIILVHCVGDVPAYGVHDPDAGGDTSPPGDSSANDVIAPDSATDAGASDANDGSTETGSDSACSPPVAATPSSCVEAGAGLSDCAGGSCCASLTVTGGTYNRNNDTSFPAKIDDFQLDTYEVTVGRFRKFVDAVVGGYKPSAGDGKHAHLNCGKGLQQAGGSTYEAGWDTSWNSNLATTKAGWNSNLECAPSSQTWYQASLGNDDRPINCETWYEAYAFCIWDGGFLPSEAEWEYVAAAGTEERTYPWPDDAGVPGNDTKLAVYNSLWQPDAGPNQVLNIAPVGSVPAGDSKWGHTNLAGNVWEWTADWYQTPYTASCTNCTNLTPSTNRVIRGGSWGSPASTLLSAGRNFDTPGDRGPAYGFRCARVP